ncbi:polysaccharide pyruvyl transferase family protein [Providencia rettgeri]
MSFKGLLGAVKDILRLIPRYSVIKKFKNDIEHRYQLSPSLSRNSLSDYVNNNCDILVSGSDQIWNPVCVSEDNDLNSVYFLNFGNEEIKRISYASSMGAYKLTQENIPLVSEYLKKYDFISVREKETNKNIENLLNIKSTHVLDPTLLLRSNEWLNHFPNKTQRVTKLINKKYILFYSVPKTKQTRIVLNYFAKITGLEVISIDQDIYPYYSANTKIRDASISEFIHLFNNAHYVITDSFHGVCFSLIFRKNFYAISPGELSNRLISLLDLISLSNRLIQDTLILEKNGITNINYDAIEENINLAISNSKTYLDLALCQSGTKPIPKLLIK